MKLFQELTAGERHRKILRLIRNSWAKLGISMVCMALISGSTAALAFLIKNILDDIFIAQNGVMLKVVTFVVLGVSLVRGVAVLAKEYFMNNVGQTIITTLRNELYGTIQDLSLSFFQKERTGVLMSRITNDVTLIQAMVSTSVTAAIEHVFTIIGLTGVIIYRDWKLALVALVVVPVAFYPIVKLGRRVRKVSTGTQQSVGELNTFLHETFAGAKIIKAFGREEYEKQRFYKKSWDLFRFEMKKVKAKALSSPVTDVCGGLGIAAVVWYGGHGVIKGTSTTGTFLSFLTAVMLLYEPLKKLSKLNNTVQEGLAALDRVFEIIEMEPEITDRPGAVELSPSSHRVAFEDVTFSYGEDPVLKGINLSAEPGEVIALVGMSGGGKSTFINLIPRFYDVTSGRIAIDDVDIRNVTLASLRSRIAMVTQDAILFNESIRDNIAYGNSDATWEDIVAASKAAYAYRFIMSLPDGFDTRIGELGSRLSGGEKQRLCIARALLKDAPILLLDEATSALDTEAEKVVQDALENLMKGRTTFVIAHRLSTIQHADRIVVVSKGEIVEEGKHDDLLARDGEYARLHTMQFARRRAGEKS
ncbi:ABC transporter ATP-binding protein [Desulfoluna butyratoxydans]|uniref:Abc transporter transmembrane region n=1 Tax=Desulfoluna butyratoxydans TaxID=231438 RepID=A0A4U8YUB3_9BACT|nr:ABC transporter ATP-binding protein [Desulfoluna butyratoxydans]VFQ46999.1 abc transporter transmembrane region [Desulfoluna butyratoxydans]